jgi:hypothetical protein
MTIAAPEIQAPRTLRGIDPKLVFRWIVSRWRLAASCDLDQCTGQDLKDMGIESSEMYQVSKVSLMYLRAGPRGP